MIYRHEPGTKTLGFATVKLDNDRPRNVLGLRGRRIVGNGIHFERALTLSTEGGKDQLFLLLSKSLSLPGGKMQQKYKCRVETTVGHWERPAQLSIHDTHQIWEAIRRRSECRTPNLSPSSPNSYMQSLRPFSRRSRRNSSGRSKVKGGRIALARGQIDS